MKKFFICWIFLLTGFSVLAQGSYEPTTIWPYIYKDFAMGEVQRPGGSTKEAYFNIHIGTGRLHFIEDGFIKEVNPADVNVLSIGSDLFVNVGGRMMRVLVGDDKGFIAKDTSVDQVELNATGGAYGSSSSTLATRASSSLDGISGVVNMNHMELKNKMDSGKVLPVLERMYIVVLPRYVYAGKKDLMEMDGLDKEAMKSFLKDNKIKWNDPNSLMQIVKFLSE